jgi:hypothetical protein
MLLTTWLVPICVEERGLERAPLEIAYSATGLGVNFCRGERLMKDPPFVATARLSHLSWSENAEPKSNSTVKYP